MERDIRMALEISRKREDGWEPPIFKTEAILGKGIFELIYGVYRHKQALEQSRALEKKLQERIKATFLEILETDIMTYLIEKIEKEGNWEIIIHDLMDRRTDPYTIAENILSEALKKD
jgi:LAO/AO transport system kinase